MGIFSRRKSKKQEPSTPDEQSWPRDENGVPQMHPDATKPDKPWGSARYKRVSGLTIGPEDRDFDNDGEPDADPKAMFNAAKNLMRGGRGDMGGADMSQIKGGMAARKEMMEAMKGMGTPKNAEEAEAMQKQMMEVLEKHGLDTPGMGEAGGADPSDEKPAG